MMPMPMEKPKTTTATAMMMMKRKKKIEKWKELVDEAKRRAMVWLFFVAALAYVLSLTSSSVWLNIPIAACILVIFRYFSMEWEIHKRAETPDIPPHLAHLMKYQLSMHNELLSSPPISMTWRRKFESPAIEATVDNFTRHIVKEFVTDSWYSRLSPDKSVPEQIRYFINDILAELGQRIKRINLVNLITRDIVELVGNHLTLFRKMKNSVRTFESLSSEEREESLKRALIKSNRLHPALHSQESETKVLQQLMSGVVAVVLQPQDVQCAVMRGIVRELLACAVMRPVMNIANPGFVNKNIEKAIISLREKSQTKSSATPTTVCPQNENLQDGCTDISNSNKSAPWANRISDGSLKYDNPTKHDGSTRTLTSESRESALKEQNARGAWRAASAPSTDKKGMRLSLTAKQENQKPNQAIQLEGLRVLESPIGLKDTRQPAEVAKLEKKKEHLPSNQSYGYGSPQLEARSTVSGRNVWDPNPGVRHPSTITSSNNGANAFNEPKNTGLRHRPLGIEPTLVKTDQMMVNNDMSLGHFNTQMMHFPMGNNDLDPSGNWLTEYGGAFGQDSSLYSPVPKLNCWVVGAHLEKASSNTFAVYSIAVTDSDNNTWFVERRFRNFEQLHRKLRDLSQYNLQLPPKRFLGSSLDDGFVRDRCILLDKYLKDLLSIPSIAELHEVWDFLSVTSKSYAHSKSPSVMKTLAVNVDDAVDDMFRQLKGVSDGLLRRVGGPSPEEISQSMVGERQKLHSMQEILASRKLEQDSDEEYGEDEVADFMEGSASDDGNSNHFVPHGTRLDRGGSGGFSVEESTVGSDVCEEESSVPPEWTPSKLAEPLLSLIDNVFQLHDKHWISRQVFWIAKQILQLGMGDAVDDWLMSRIQYLGQEDTVITSIKAVENILWPDGVFITKAKKNEENVADSQKGMEQQPASFESQLEAARCARVVYEALVDGAPAPLISFLGKQEYSKSAKDIYHFLQSSVFLKQMMYSILEMLLAATCPELVQFIVDVRQASFVRL